MAFSVEALTSILREKLTSRTTFNPMHAALRSDPYPIYRALREYAPMHRSYLADGWTLSRYDDVEAVLTGRAFGCEDRKLRRWPKIEARSRRAGIPSSYESGLATVLREDEPNHTRLRSLAAKAFTHRAIARMRPPIEGLLNVAMNRIPNVMTSLVQAEEEGKRLDSDELVSIAVLLLVAGNETTARKFARRSIRVPPICPAACDLAALGCGHEAIYFLQRTQSSTRAHLSGRKRH